MKYIETGRTTAERQENAQREETAYALKPGSMRARRSRTQGVWRCVFFGDRLGTTCHLLSFGWGFYVLFLFFPTFFFLFRVL